MNKKKMPNEKINSHRTTSSRRDILSMLYKGIFLATHGAFVCPSLLLASESLSTVPNLLNNSLARALFSIGKPKCTDAAKQLKTIQDPDKKIYFEVRDAEINATDASTIANSFYNISKKELSRLCSFSLSYNTQIGNAGIMSLVKALPLSIHEIGFVDCGFGYQGAQALLGMIKKSPLLHTLCIEGNHIPKNVRNKFLELNQENPHLSIYI